MGTPLWQFVSNWSDGVPLPKMDSCWRWCGKLSKKFTLRAPSLHTQCVLSQPPPPLSTHLCHLSKIQWVKYAVLVASPNYVVITPFFDIFLKRKHDFSNFNYCCGTLFVPLQIAHTAENLPLLVSNLCLLLQLAPRCLDKLVIWT